MPFTRRDFLKRGTLFLAMGVTAPTFLTTTARVLADEADQCMTGPSSKRILVVVQFGGGNDGLNNVVPYGDQLYYQARPSIAIAKNEVLPLTDYIGFNPNLSPLKSLYDAGHLAVVQGVGYPNPNRSHFRSTDIWMTARPDIVEPTGWLGRYLDATCSGEDKSLAAIDYGDTTSKLFWTGQSIVPSISSIEGFDFMTDPRFPNDRHNQVDTLKLLNTDSSGKDYTAYVSRAALDALDTADQLKKIASTYTSTLQYPNSPFARGLQTIAKLISADLGTKIFHITVGGFDTHAGQARTHNTLLKTVAEGVEAFMRDLEGMGRADDVVLMTFSEFGRRVKENASGGTDHGEAAPLFVVGGGVRAGVFGDHPSLTDLDNGDLKYKLDFRSVYGTMIQDWLGADPTGIIGGGTFPRIGFVASPSTPASGGAPLNLPHREIDAPGQVVLEAAAK
jgi:uncharacterized protein (DUF1501 family)